MILSLCHWWIVGLWVAMLLYWAIAAMFLTRGRDRRALRRGIGLRLGLALTVILAIALARRSVDLQALQLAEFRSVPMAVLSAIIATAGAALAFTARAVIGRNWGTPGSRQADTELVTSGPYALVRHPIYTGILLMMIGTAVGLIPTWWLVAAAAGVYFVHSARAEERFMAERFPDTYPAYRSRTRMLLPFLF